MEIKYTDKELEDLIDGKLPFRAVHRMLSNFKDPTRFHQIVDILQRRVSWNERILLPYALHLYIVLKNNKDKVVKCDCGYEFGPYTQNWKLGSSIRVRRTDEDFEEIYPPMMHCEPGYQELREYFCPGCATLLDVEAVPIGYPIVFDFLPDLEGFYKEWLGEELPG